MYSKCKENLTKNLLKLFENESKLFTETESRSWSMHLQPIIELAENHEVRNTETIIELIRWTLGPGLMMVRDKFKSEPDHTRIGFLRHVDSKYSSEITHALIRSSLSSVSLARVLKSRDHGEPSTRSSRAVTLTVNSILKLA